MTPQWKRTNATLHDKETYGAHDIRNMADARPARRTEVQHLRAGRNEDLVQATQHARSQLAPERIPHAIFDLRAVRTAIVDRDALLAVHGLAGDEIFGDEHRLLALCDEDALV